jgi:hypothetical protein
MSVIDPKWISEFFEMDENEDFYIDDTIKVKDGKTLPKLLAEFLDDKISEHYSYLE